MKEIYARERFEGEFIVPGDKSITHRAIMLNASVDGESLLSNVSLGEDCLATCRCLEKLGAKIQADGGNLRVFGTSEFRSNVELDCGNSGTTMRLLTGLLAGKGIDAKLYGDKSLSLRPMQRVAEPLSILGAKIQTTNGKPPVIVQSANLSGADIRLNISSAQVKSAVLLAGINADGVTSVSEPIKSRDHTERALRAMGGKIQVDGCTVRVEKSALRPIDVEVPCDISSASYFMALGALKGKTLCKNVGVNSTRIGILHAFDKLGVKYSLCNYRTRCGEEIADIVVEKSHLRAIELGAKEIPSMIDELPLIALLCAFADGESRITGAQELAVKESDRILGTAELINAIGGECTPTQDGFIIRGKSKLYGGRINSRGDHRLAMTGAVALVASQNGGVIENEECCAVSFPQFFLELER